MSETSDTRDTAAIGILQHMIDKLTSEQANETTCDVCRIEILARCKPCISTHIT